MGKQTEQTVEALTFPNSGIQNTKDFVSAVDFVEKVETLLKKAKEHMQGYISENGNVELPDGDMYGDFKKEGRTIGDVKEAISALTSGGVSKDKIWDKLTLAPGKAESLAKQGEGGKQKPIDLSQIIQTKESNSFGRYEGNKGEEA